MNNLQITQEMSEILISGVKALEEVSKLTERFHSLESTVTQLCEYNCDQGWVTLAAAATRCGFTTTALRQRIKKNSYPEDIVWKQESGGKAIFVHVAELRNHI